MLPHIDSIQHFFLRQFIDPAFNIGYAWEHFIKQEERRMKPKCYMRQLLFKIVLISLAIILSVYRQTVLRAASLFDLWVTVSGYATVWCHIKGNSALNCEVRMQTHMPNTSQCDENLGSDIYNFCGA